MTVMLKSLEAQICQLHDGLALKTTLEKAAQIGELLLDAKKQLGHGDFQTWCRRKLPFSYRSAAVYMQAAKVQATASFDGELTLDKFLKMMRDARRETATADGSEPQDATCRAINVDCRDHQWGSGIALVTTDPPWMETEPYDWLGQFGAKSLIDGGLMLVQCGTSVLPDRIARLTSAGLTFRWLFSITYKMAHRSRPRNGICARWLPVVVVSKGKPRRSQIVSDAYIVGGLEKHYHDWQQPSRPWFHWIAGLTLPGEQIVDPYCGSASTGVATKAIGNRLWTGTDIDDTSVNVARKRISQTTLGWRKELDD